MRSGDFDDLLTGPPRPIRLKSFVEVLPNDTTVIYRNSIVLEKLSVGQVVTKKPQIIVSIQLPVEEIRSEWVYSQYATPNISRPSLLVVSNSHDMQGFIGVIMTIVTIDYLIFMGC